MPAFAGVPHYNLDKEQSSLSFTATQNSAPVKGGFSDFSVEIDFDPAQLELSSIHVEVQIGSLNMSDENILGTLKMPEWFATERFPRAVFNAPQIQKTGEQGQYMAKGMLTLKGQSQPVTLYFTIQHLDDTSAVADGYATIMRNDFNVGEGEWASADSVKNDVRINFHIAANKTSNP